MNRRVCLCVGLSFSCLILLIAPTTITRAQDLPTVGGPAGGGISSDIKNAPNAESFRGKIQQFITGQVNGLSSEDPAAQKTAREKLIGECSSGSSQSYFDIYGQELNDQVVPLLTAGKPMRVRLNVAVVLGQVAQVGKTAKVEPAVLLAVNDPLEPVALKGMQAAKPVLLVVFQNPAQIATDKLVAAIPAAVKKHPKCGLIANDAYRALIPEVAPNLTQQQVNAAVPSLFDPILDVLDFRVTLYRTSIPDTPQAESPLPSFFANPHNFAAAGAKQQQRVVQEFVNLVALAGEQVATASKADAGEVISILKYAAQTLLVIEKSKRGDAVVDPVLNDVMSLQPGATPATIPPKTRQVFGQMQTIYPTLTAPPQATPAAPTTAATSSSTPQTASSGH
jgi:hypothetical protein